MPSPPIVAVEDAVSAAVCERLLAQYGLAPANVLGLKGIGYLKKKANNFNQTAIAYPVFLLADSDSPDRCGPRVVDSFLSTPMAPLMLFRVAIAEVESWLLADRVGISELLSLPVEKIPLDVERLLDPKQTIINLARKSSNSAVRSAFVPTPRSTASVGPLYNTSLIAFVQEKWNVSAGAELSESLRRAVAAMDAWVQRIG